MINQATLGFIPGLGLVLGQYALIRNVAALPIGMTFSRFAFVFFLTLVMCSVSGMIATRKVRRLTLLIVFRSTYASGS